MHEAVANMMCETKVSSHHAPAIFGSPAIIRETRASLAGASQIFLGRPFRPGITSPQGPNLAQHDLRFHALTRVAFLESTRQSPWSTWHLPWIPRGVSFATTNKIEADRSESKIFPLPRT